ncbi:MAG TPA: helix-turn-helix domain-containing protein [Vicinamibacterales bacterium]
MEQLYQPDTPLLAADLAGKSVFIEQAMQMLGVSKRTVYYWIRQGRLRTIRTRGGSQRVLLASIRDLVNGQAPTAARPVSSEALTGFTS